MWDLPPFGLATQESECQGLFDTCVFDGIIRLIFELVMGPGQNFWPGLGRVSNLWFGFRKISLIPDF